MMKLLAHLSLNKVLVVKCQSAKQNRAPGGCGGETRSLQLFGDCAIISAKQVGSDLVAENVPSITGKVLSETESGMVPDQGQPEFDIACAHPFAGEGDHQHGARQPGFVRTGEKCR